MTAIFGFLTGKVGAIVAWAATAALLILLAVMWLRLGDAHSERDMARAELATCAQNTAKLRGSIDVQNTQIEALRKASADATAQAEAALAKARTASQAAHKSAQAILALKPVGRHCDAALALIREPTP